MELIALGLSIFGLVLIFIIPNHFADKKEVSKLQSRIDLLEDLLDKKFLNAVMHIQTTNQELRNEFNDKIKQPKQVKKSRRSNNDQVRKSS